MATSTRKATSDIRIRERITPPSATRSSGVNWSASGNTPASYPTLPQNGEGPFGRQARFRKKPGLQARFAMGLAMIFAICAMLGRPAGASVQHIQPADLNPVKIWGTAEASVIHVKNRMMSYYENIRLVYQIERHLKDLPEEQNASERRHERRSSRTKYVAAMSELAAQRNTSQRAL